MKRFWRILRYKIARQLLQGSDWKLVPFTWVPYPRTPFGLNDFAYRCHAASVQGGWWHDHRTGERLKRNKGEMIALMHSELSEMLEGVRKDAMDDKLPHRRQEEVEMVDVLIREFDYAGGFELDLDGGMLEKMEFNAVRADHKPENRAKSDGKQF